MGSDLFCFFFFFFLQIKGRRDRRDRVQQTVRRFGEQGGEAKLARWRWEFITWGQFSIYGAHGGTHIGQCP
jgi:hypothetical protein